MTAQSRRVKPHWSRSLASVAAAAPITSPNALVQHFYKADADCGTGVAKGLGLDIKKIAASIDTMVMAD